jgi:hypothetical protein
MTHRLATCPACGQLSLHLELTESQSAKLFDWLKPDADSGIRWRFRTLICQRCGKPLISLWPFEGDVDGVLNALGIPRESLHCPEKGGVG